MYLTRKHTRCIKWNIGWITNLKVVKLPHLSLLTKTRCSLSEALTTRASAVCNQCQPTTQFKSSTLRLRVGAKWLCKISCNHQRPGIWYFVRLWEWILRILGCFGTTRVSNGSVCWICTSRDGGMSGLPVRSLLPLSMGRVVCSPTTSSWRIRLRSRCAALRRCLMKRFWLLRIFWSSEGPTLKLRMISSQWQV